MSLLTLCMKLTMIRAFKKIKCENKFNRYWFIQSLLKEKWLQKTVHHHLTERSMSERS